MQALSKKELTEMMVRSVEAISLLTELSTKLVEENERLKYQVSGLTHELSATQHDLQILKMFILKD